MAELAIGVVSLTFQVFAGCMKAYQLLSDARGMPKDLQYLRVRFKTEQFRLLDWAQVVHLSERDDTLIIGTANRALLLDVLDQQQTQILRFGRYDERLQKLATPLIVDDQDAAAGQESGATPSERRVDSDFQMRFPHTVDLLNKCLKYMDKTRMFPARLRWATWDKAKMEGLVVRLSALNDFLKELLSSHQLETLLETQMRTNYQIMQLNSKLDQLVEIFESQRLVSTAMVPAKGYENHLTVFLRALGLEGANKAEAHDSPADQLGVLAQVKALGVGVDTAELTDHTARELGLGPSVGDLRSVKLDRNAIALLDEEVLPQGPLAEDQRLEAIYTDVATGSQRRVWIEWKYIHSEWSLQDETETLKHAAATKTEERMRALTTLLKENQHSEQLHAAHCVGYFADTYLFGPRRCLRYGLVFNKPTWVQEDVRPVSLLELLNDKRRGMPSLTTRIALCVVLSECLERFHAVNWLHKSLRSHNVVFFSTNSGGDINLGRPYLSGFDYSRPTKSAADSVTESEVLVRNPAHDIYRHPRVQGSGREEDNSYSGFRKTYDMYSLGVILLEIAFWKPIDAILGIENLRKARLSEVLTVHHRLQANGSAMRDVRGMLGDKLHSAIGACLEGRKAFGLGEESREKSAEDNAMLQQAFYDRVIRQLKSIQV